MTKTLDLLQQLPTLSDDQLKNEYLQALQGRESLVQILPILDDEAQAQRIVNLALEVNLTLGAKLVGAIKPKFHPALIDFVAGLDIPQPLKMQLLGITRSDIATPILLQALKQEDFHVLRSAVRALVKIGTEAVVTGLLQALIHGNYEMRRWTAWGLGQIDSESVVTELLEVLKHEVPYVRMWAAAALGQIHNQAAVTGLVQALNDEDPEVRGWAASALGKMGTEAAVSPLLQALSDREPQVRWRAASALGQIRNEGAVPSLLQALSDRESQVRWRAATALGQIRSEGAVPSLLQALDDEHSYVRWSAVSALAQIGSRAAVPGLLQALGDQDRYVRGRVAYALGQIGTEAAVVGLLQALKDRDSFVRERAAEGLKHMEIRTSVGGLLPDYMDWGSPEEKETPNLQCDITSASESHQFPTIFIESCIQASDRLLSTTQEPLIKYLISIGDPGDDPPEGYHPVTHRLRLEFHDIITPLNEPEDVLATPKAILKVLDFVSLISQCDGDVLIHCPVGISRSPAIALTIYAMLLGAGKEKDALAMVLEARPQAVPNSWIVELADEALGRDGRLVKVAQNHENLMLENETL
ncbi:MAG: HEAT repeat domain-containing protein [Cyanobacteriota bacterium]